MFNRFATTTGSKTIGVITQRLQFGDFTDNTDATGYVNLTTTLPAGAIPLGWKAVVATGFTGDTSAVMQVGVAGDLARFSAKTTGSVFAAGTIGSAPTAAKAFDGIGAASTLRVTVTGAADFTSIAAGDMTISFYYVA